MKRPKDEDNSKKDIPKGPQKTNPKSKTSLRKANKLLADHNINMGADHIDVHNINMGADGTTSQAWLVCTKVTSKASIAAVLSSDDSITFTQALKVTIYPPVKHINWIIIVHLILGIQWYVPIIIP